MRSDSPAATDERAEATPASQSLPVPRLSRFVPSWQVLRYVAVGGCNTVFGYGCYAAFVYLYGHFLPTRYLPFTVDLASVTATPIGVTFSFLTYKVLVFRTEGNWLKEWLRCLVVYGSATIPGLFVLPLLTRLLQSTSRFHGSAAGYIAGAVVMILTAIYTYFAHKNYSFSRSSAR